ncbi:hypothetical protein O3P69_010292 [Scylla paramamosain]|uniref:Uncharacterized protein n=1 Tax=Scylla paramamosain TaxID=85552 RepID=A0AAW0TWC1_SCYPA
MPASPHTCHTCVSVHTAAFRTSVPTPHLRTSNILTWLTADGGTEQRKTSSEMMRYVFLAVALVVGVAWGRPSETLQLSTTPPTATMPTVQLIKDLGNLTIHVTHNPEGDYGLEVYDNDLEKLLPSTVFSLPGDWKPPGLEKSRIVHSEFLESGDVVVAFFSLENSLDLILLPKELFVYKKTNSGVIVFPKLDVPWHPTVSTSTEYWAWPNTTAPYNTTTSTTTTTTTTTAYTTRDYTATPKVE